MPNKMIERVAREMFKILCPGIRYLEADKEFYEEAAKAAITAMREPTEEMVEASFDSTYFQTARQSEIKNCWRLMIDAALKD